MLRQTKWFASMAILVLTGCAETPGVTDPSIHAQFAAPSSDLAVTSRIADTDVSIAPALQVRSDGLGAYSGGGTSLIQSVGAYVLDLTASKGTRKLTVDFSQPIAGTGPNGGAPVAIPSGGYKVHMIAKCNLYGTNVRTLAPGATIACPLHIGTITFGGATYAVQMNPRANSGDVSYPDTNYANVTCTAPASGTGPCTQWLMTPSGTRTDANGVTYAANVGKLLKQVTSGRTTTSVDQGNFYFSFAFTLSNP